MIVLVVERISRSPFTSMSAVWVMAPGAIEVRSPPEVMVPVKSMRPLSSCTSVGTPNCASSSPNKPSRFAPKFSNGKSAWTQTPPTPLPVVMLPPPVISPAARMAIPKGSSSGAWGVVAAVPERYSVFSPRPSIVPSMSISIPPIQMAEAAASAVTTPEMDTLPAPFSAAPGVPLSPCRLASEVRMIFELASPSAVRLPVMVRFPEAR